MSDCLPDLSYYMSLKVFPGSPLRGSLSLPGDKSLSHRAALFAALARGESRIENFLLAGVTRPLLNALRALGVAWDLQGNTLTVQGRGIQSWRAVDVPLDCGNSATTMRLLAGAIAAKGIPAVLDGSPGLRRRPMARIVAPLQRMGVPVTAAGGCAPLTFAARPSSRPLRPMRYALPVASAQVKTCLLLAALAAEGPTTLIEPAPSRDHSERLLRSMGVSLHLEKTPSPTVTLTPPTSPLAPLHLTLPGDISSAAFLIVAALITPGSQITLRGVGLNPTRTGLLDALRRMGAELHITNLHENHNEPVGDITVHHSRLRGTTVEGALVVRMIDEFPVFSVAAAFAQGTTVVREAAELRHKESDRIRALCEQLRAVGVEIHETSDGFSLSGSTPPRGGVIHPHGDHRLAMALAVAGLAAAGPITVEQADIIGESFPGFTDALVALGAHVVSS